MWVQPHNQNQNLKCFIYSSNSMEMYILTTKVQESSRYINFCNYADLLQELYLAIHHIVFISEITHLFEGL